MDNSLKNRLNKLYSSVVSNATYYFSKTLKILKPRGDFKIHQIDYCLYQGNIIKDQVEMDILKRRGIKHVVSIMEPWEWKYANGDFTLDEDFTHHFFSVPDCCSLDIEYIESALELVEFIKDKYPEDKIYINCFYGRGRSAVLLYAYLMKTYTLTAREVEIILDMKISNIFLNYKQRKSISQYENKLYSA